MAAGKLIALVLGRLSVLHEESFILAEKTASPIRYRSGQSAGIANSLTGDTLADILKQP